MYRCLTQNNFVDSGNYSIVAIRECDMEVIRQWRNAQINVLRQKKAITPQEQKRYFEEVIGPSFIHPEPSQLLFSLLLQDRLIGYGGIVHIDWEARRGEVSFLVNPDRAADPSLYASDFTHFLRLLCRAAFTHFGFHRLYVETYAFRTTHISLLEGVGFQHEGLLREHIFKDNQWHNSLLHGLLAHEYFHAE